MSNPIASTISQNDLRDFHMQASVGSLVNANAKDRLKTLTNANPQLVQADTGTLSGSFASGTEFWIEVNGSRTTLIASTEGSLAGVATALAAKLESNPDARALVSAEASAAVINLSANLASYSVAISASPNIAIASVRAAVETPSVPFGRLVLDTGYADQRLDPAGSTGALIGPDSFTNQLDVFQIEYAAGELLLIDIEGPLGRAQLSVAMDTDLATTLGDVLAAVNGAGVGVVMPPGPTLTLGVFTPGSEFIAEVTRFDSSTGDPIAPVIGTSNRGPGTSLKLALGGISVQNYAEEAGIGGSSGYAPKAPMVVVETGGVWVATDPSEPAPSKGGLVYAETASGESQGTLHTVPAVGRVRVPGAQWERGARTGSGDSIGALKVDFY